MHFASRAREEAKLAAAETRGTVMGREETGKKKIARERAEKEVGFPHPLICEPLFFSLLPCSALSFLLEAITFGFLFRCL